jgi:hypothetical protein
MANNDFRVGQVKFGDVPITEDPRALIRTLMGLGGVPGAARAGMGMLGHLGRAYNAMPTVERMFSGVGGAAPGMLSGSIFKKREKYTRYAENVQSAGKSPLPFADWIKAGEPEE